jgi:hypothetical protein
MHLESRTRRGMVLFIVVAMLALFAVVSVAFYYYATQESMASRLTLDAQQRLRPDPDALFAYALRQLVFDEPGNGPFKSHMATHSLLRNLFGSEGLEPFSGTGRLHGQDYSYYGSPTIWYDHYYATCYFNRSYNPAQDGSCNPPYTYPDMTHVFLGHLAYDPGTDNSSRPPNPSFADHCHSRIHLHRRSIHTIRRTFSSGRTRRGVRCRPGMPPMPPALRQALVFRPHPLLHPNFPPPADIGGDVRNLPPGIPVKLGPSGQLHYGNDSIWMDLGFPVQTGPDGRTYKPLFAFFITDLDGRLNLNQVFWNQGLIFASGESPAGLNGHHEMEAILRHGDTLADSFTSLLFPKLPNTMKDLRRRHMLTTYSADLRYAGFVPQIYPNSSEAPSMSTNPDDGPRWKSPYPMQYDVPPGTSPGPNNNPRVLWPGSALKPYTNSGDFNLGNFLVKNVGGTWEWTGRISRRVNRYDQSGIPVGTATFPSLQRLNLTAAIQSLPGYPKPFDPANPGDTQRLADAIAKRQKLAREIYFRLLYVCGLLDENPAPITAPAPGWLSKVYPTRPQWPPTGVRAHVVGPNPASPDPTNPTDEELKPLRFLAQLAVNIVDFLDPDDYSTPFMFYTDMDGYPLDDPTKPAASAPTPNLRYWVFGTELPRIVVNEVLFEYQEPSTNTTFDMFCWVELFNPSGKPETLGPDSGASPKVTDPRYKVVIARADPTAWTGIDPIAGAINGDNVLGEFKPDDKRTETTGADFVQGGSPWQLPNNNSPYLVLGPDGDTIDSTLSDPMNTPANWVQTANLKFTLKRNGGNWEFTTPSGDVTETKEYLVLLRRLAYTEMNKLDVPQTISVYNHPILGAIPDYHPDFNPLLVNPYLTQDMMRVENGKGLCNRANAGSQSKSWARRNPYADASDALEANQVTVSGTMTNTWHTLGKQNSGFVSAPPAHPNDATGNTMQLLKVSAYKTHLLTRRYQNSSYSEYHYAPWFDPTARIYRALEFLELTPNRRPFDDVRLCTSSRGPREFEYGQRAGDSGSFVRMAQPERI